MDNFNLVTLSGVITDPRAGLNYIMSCFFFSKYSQSDLFKGKIISLSQIIKEGGDNAADISNGIDRGLSDLLGRYFQVVNLNVTAEDSGHSIEVSIEGYVITSDSTGEKRLDLGYVLSSSDGTFKKIVDRLNNEVLY